MTRGLSYQHKGRRVNFAAGSYAESSSRQHDRSMPLSKTSQTWERWELHERQSHDFRP